jgi:tRNA-specific 2-thiouridylase
VSCVSHYHNAACELAFSDAQWAVTPGQSAVLYQGEVCLGGGVITASNVQNQPAAPSRAVFA